jgi:hypothetical protein
MHPFHAHSREALAGIEAQGAVGTTIDAMGAAFKQIVGGKPMRS